MWPFKKKNPNAGNPQYNPGVTTEVNPGQYNPNIVAQLQHPAVVTSGFHDNEIQAFNLSYGLRQQPDLGGALNYAYENYGLPLTDILGAFMGARRTFLPFGSAPLAFFSQTVPTGIGTIPGQFVGQPLLNPQGPGSGYDIYS